MTSIPLHPQPGIYETTEVSFEYDDGKGFTYDHRAYEEQRDRPAWTPQQASDRATEAMLDAGWTPAVLPKRVDGVGGPTVLVPPSPEVRVEMARLEQQNADAGDGVDKPNPQPGRQAVAKKPSAKKAAPKKGVAKNP